ncbi:hypothetical protein Tco_0143390 [Tanacetum coccineum]
MSAPSWKSEPSVPAPCHLRKMESRKKSVFKRLEKGVTTARDKMNSVTCTQTTQALSQEHTTVAQAETQKLPPKVLVQEQLIRFRGPFKNKRASSRRTEEFSESESSAGADFDLEEEIRLVENLLYDNSSPRPPEELNLEIADTILDSLSPSPIPVADSDSLMEEIDLFLASDDSMPPGIEDDDYDSEGDIRFLEELLNNDSLPLPEFESFHFDPSFPRPPPEPPDVKISLIIETDVPVINNVDELNEDECFDPGGGEMNVFTNVEVDNSFTFVTWIFLPYLTYPEVRILQKSQESGQNRTNTDTGKEREYKSRENAIKGQQKSTLGQH